MSSSKTHSVSAKKTSFEKDGYVLVKGFFSEADIDASRRWLDDNQKSIEGSAKSWTDFEPGNSLSVFQYIHNAENAIAKMASNEKLLNMAAELMNESVYIWSSKVNFKPPWLGTVEYFHQDYVYWMGRGYEKIDMLSCMIFLDSHGNENAGLQIFPGTHKLGFIEHTPFINTNGLSKYMVPPERLSILAKEYGFETVEAEPGDILFFHSALVHGSSHNSSPHKRRVILSQLNCGTNKPKDVLSNAKNFNLERTEREVAEARRRLEWFEKKYHEQMNASGPAFNAPVVEQEKGGY